MFGVLFLGIVSFGVSFKWIYDSFEGFLNKKVIQYPELNAETIRTVEDNFILIPRSFNPDNLDIEINCVTINDREMEIYPLQSEIDSYLVLPSFNPKECGFKKVSVSIKNGDDISILDWDVAELLSLEKIIEIYNKNNSTTDLADAYD